MSVAAGLSTSPTNRLKYWEKLDVSHFHDMLLRAISDSQFKPYHAQGVNMTRMTPPMQETLNCFVRKIVKDLDRHKPWVIKDPRMLLSEHWLAQVCRLSASCTMGSAWLACLLETWLALIQANVCRYFQALPCSGQCSHHSAGH